MKMENVKINVVTFDFGEVKKTKECFTFKRYPLMDKKAWDILNERITELDLDVNIFTDKLLEYIEENCEFDFPKDHSPIGFIFETSDDYNELIFLNKDLVRDFIKLVSLNIDDITLVSAIDTKHDGPEVIIGVFQTTKDIDKKIDSLIKLSGRIKKKIDYKGDHNLSDLKTILEFNDDGVGDDINESCLSAIEFTEDVLEEVILSLTVEEEGGGEEVTENIININLSLKIEDKTLYEKFKEDFSSLLKNFGIEK
jgi:hypothetical protein